jgi:PhzF family phenazine biosynthesis protein
MKIETYIVDSFTDEAFKGNPAGVCLLHSPLDKIQMQSIAFELGLSETAFIQHNLNDNTYSIRYFSPKVEIPLCGHATLASSKVLFKKYEHLESIIFITNDGVKLNIKREEESIIMLFPAYDVVNMAAPIQTLESLGIKEILNSVYNKETNILMLEIKDSDTLKQLNPNYEALVKSNNRINGVLVTAISKQKGYDFESRYFWPWSGTNEDPVTGATHTFLTKYWSKKLDKTKMKSYQCSERTGFMEVELIDENNITIKSQAKIVLEGFLTI